MPSATAAWLLLLPSFVACFVVGGCEPSCDEEAECSQGKFSNCGYEGCGQIFCLAIAIEGHVVCNEDGTEGCSSWPEIDADCARLFAVPEEQAECTQLLHAVTVPATSNGSACRAAVLDVAPCAVQNDVGSCDFASIDASCFSEPLGCE